MDGLEATGRPRLSCHQFSVGARQSSGPVALLSCGVVTLALASRFVWAPVATFFCSPFGGHLSIHDFIFWITFEFCLVGKTVPNGYVRNIVCCRARKIAQTLAIAMIAELLHQRYCSVAWASPRRGGDTFPPHDRRDASHRPSSSPIGGLSFTVSSPCQCQNRWTAKPSPCYLKHGDVRSARSSMSLRTLMEQKGIDYPSFLR